jgi:diaminopimelate epimerase
MSDQPFLKMHGLGNDFVVLDARGRSPALTPAIIRAIGDRRRGVGFDQLLVLEPPSQGGTVFMRIYNPDGSEAGACGNGTRCVAHVMLAEAHQDQVEIETIAGRLTAQAMGDQVSVNMGAPRIGWQDVPMREPVDTQAFILPGFEYLGPASVLSMGNPHVVFFVDAPESYDLAKLGPDIETHEWFPDRVNVSIAHRQSPSHVRLKVWERGAGATLACGTAACATTIAGARRALLDRQVRVSLPGGDLSIDWRQDGTVWMQGPVAYSFSGLLPTDLWVSP